MITIKEECVNNRAVIIENENKSATFNFRNGKITTIEYSNKNGDFHRLFVDEEIQFILESYLALLEYEQSPKEPYMP